MEKRFALYEVVDNPSAVPNGSVVCLHNVSPGSWLRSNPGDEAAMDALEARAPLGWEHVQLDGICRYDLIITERTREQVLADRGVLDLIAE